MVVTCQNIAAVGTVVLIEPSQPQKLPLEAPLKLAPGRSLRASSRGRLGPVFKPRYRKLAPSSGQ